MTLMRENNQEGTDGVRGYKEDQASGRGHDRAATALPFFLPSTTNWTPNTKQTRETRASRGREAGCQDAQGLRNDAAVSSPLHFVSSRFPPVYSKLVTGKACNLKMLQDTEKQVSWNVCSLSRPRTGTGSRGSQTASALAGGDQGNTPPCPVQRGWPGSLASPAWQYQAPAPRCPGTKGGAWTSTPVRCEQGAPMWGQQRPAKTVCTDTPTR